MPVSSQGFFDQLNRNLSKTKLGKMTQPTACKTVYTQLKKIQYQDISDSDMRHVAHVLNQHQKKENLVLHRLITNQNMDKENRKKKYIEHLLQHLYFVELQALIWRGYGKKQYLNSRRHAKAIRKEIADLLNPDKKENKDLALTPGFCEKAWAGFKKEIQEMASEFTSLSSLIQRAGNAHIWRIALVFARISFQEMLLTFSRLDFFIDLLGRYPNKYAGFEVNLEVLLQFINDSRVVFNSLSVALPAARLLFHLALLIKHSLSSTKEEDTLEWQTRLLREVKKRHYVLVNDLVWTIINLITNFNKIFKILDSHAMVITVSFMFFDMLWLLPAWYFAWEEYLEEKNRLETELLTLGDDPDQYQKILDNLQQLHINWQAKSDANLYSFLATGLFGLGFIIATLVPVLAIPGYLLCNLAMALNMVGGDFTLMREKQLTLKASPQNLDVYQLAEQKILEEEYCMARNHFLITLAVYTIMPTLTMGVFALCWPAAIPLAAALLAFQLLYPKWKAHQQEQIDNLRTEQKQGLVEALFAAEPAALPDGCEKPALSDNSQYRLDKI